MCVQLVTCPGGLPNGGVSLDRKHVQDGALIFCGYLCEAQTLLTDKSGDGLSIQTVRLALVPCSSAAGRGPTRVDLVDVLIGCNEVLREAAAISPRSLNPELTAFASTWGPGKQLSPSGTAIGTTPDSRFLPVLVEGNRNVNSLVGVYTDRQHSSSC
jgi:hypothetical protein